MTRLLSQQGLGDDVRTGDLRVCSRREYKGKRTERRCGGGGELNLAETT